MCREAGGCSGISSTQLWALSCQSSANASKPNSFICLQQHQPQLFQNWCVKMRGYKIMKIRAWGLIILGLSGFEAGSVFGVFGGRAAAGCQLTLWVQRVLLGREEEEELVGWGGGEEENTSWGKSLIWIWEEVIFPNDGSKHERWKALSLFSCSPPLQPLLCNQSFSQKKTFNGIRAGGYIFTSEWRKCEEKWKFRRKSGTSETRGENLRKSKNWGEKWKLRMAAAMLRTLLISLHLHNLTRFEQNI